MPPRGDLQKPFDYLKLYEPGEYRTWTYTGQDIDLVESAISRLRGELWLYMEMQSLYLNPHNRRSWFEDVANSRGTRWIFGQIPRTLYRSVSEIVLPIEQAIDADLDMYVHDATVVWARTLSGEQNMMDILVAGMLDGYTRFIPEVVYMKHDYRWFHR